LSRGHSSPSLLRPSSPSCSLDRSST
jgi:hypothetical protein